MIDVLVERPPRVVGDGASTIEQLILAENERRIEARGEAGMEHFLPDAQTAVALREQGVTLRHVPGAGEEIVVKTVTNDRRLEDAWTYRGDVHADVMEQSRTAARVVGLRLAGVDVIAPRIDRSLSRRPGRYWRSTERPGYTATTTSPTETRRRR